MTTSHNISKTSSLKIKSKNVRMSILIILLFICHEYQMYSYSVFIIARLSGLLSFALMAVVILVSSKFLFWYIET